MRTGLLTTGVMALAVLTACARAEQPASVARAEAQDATRAEGVPTTRPAPDEVIVRVGDRMQITQGDIDLALRGTTPAQYLRERLRTAAGLATMMQMLLYIEDHPDDFLSPGEVEAEMERRMTEAGFTSREEAEARLRENGFTWEMYRAFETMRMARQRLHERAMARIEEDGYLERMFQEHPGRFDGAEVVARHIMFMTTPFETPEQRQTKVDRLRKIREDLLAGRRTWESCVQESDCPTRRKGGNLGPFRRHLQQPEELTRVAFKLEVGELSDVIETPTGFHLIEVTERRPSWMTFAHAKNFMEIYLKELPLNEVVEKARRKYPIVGVREPLPPEPPGTQPADEAATRPAESAEATTRPE